jgi:restriction endonuclease
MTPIDATSIKMDVIILNEHMTVAMVIHLRYSQTYKDQSYGVRLVLHSVKSFQQKVLHLVYLVQNYLMDQAGYSLVS